MSDLTIVTMQQCSDLDERKVFHVDGYDQWVERGDIACTCKGYTFRGYCKHVKELDATRCTWHENYGIRQTEEQAEKCLCPECGKPTMFVNVGV